MTAGNPIYGDVIVEETVNKLLPYKPQIESLNTRAVMIQFNEPLGGEIDPYWKGQHRAANISTAKKLETFKRIGFQSGEVRIPWETNPRDFAKILKDLSVDPHVSSIIVQRPMPSHHLYQKALKNIPDHMDIDSLKPNNPIYSTPATSEGMLRTLHPFIQDKPLVAVIGSNGAIGGGAVKYLKSQGIPVLEIDKNTIATLNDIPKADVIFTATGQKGLINAEHLRPHHRVVVDSGVSVEEINGKRKIFGDLDRNAVHIPQNYTPVPRGVGPMEMAVLAERATEQALKIKIPPWTVQSQANLSGIPTGLSIKPKGIGGCLGMLTAEVALELGLDYAVEAILRAAKVGALEANKTPEAPPPAKKAVTVTHQIKHASLLAALAGAVVGAILATAVAVVAVAVVGATGGAALAVGIGAMVIAGPLIGKAASAVTNFVDSFFPADDGPVATGSPNVFVEGLMSARAKDDTVACVKHSPPPPIAQGSDTVYINDQPAVRIDDKTACGAPIKQGAKTVYIGGNTTTVMDIADEFSFWEKALIIGVEFLIPPSRGFFTAIAKAPKILLSKAPMVIKAVMKGARNAFRSGAGKLSGKVFTTALRKGKGALKSALAGLCGLKNKKPPKRSNSKNPANNKTPITCKIGNPVDPIKGDVIKEVTDFTLGQTIPLSLTRSYRSSNKSIGLFGQGWSDSFSEHLVVDPDKQQITLNATEELIVTFDVPNGIQSVFNRRYPNLLLSIYPNGYVIYNSDTQLFHYYQYQDSGKANLIVIADRDRNHIRFYQDSGNRPVRIEHSDGIILDLHYQKNNLSSIYRIDSRMREELAHYRYDDNLLVKAWSKGKTDQEMAYNDQRMMRRICYNGISEVLYSYDKQDRCIHMCGSEGFHTWDFAYKPDRRANAARDCHKNVWEFYYNADNQVIKEVAPNGHEQQFIYDRHGLLLEQVDALGRSKKYHYDAWSGKLLQVEDSSGQMTTLNYDDNLEQIVSINAPHGETHYIYHDHKIVETRLPNKDTFNYQYDIAGNIIKIERNRGLSLQFKYDGHNRLVSAFDWLHQEQQYQYNRNDQLSQIITPKGNSWHYHYDRQGRLEKVHDPLNYVENLHYTIAHQPSVYTDANQHEQKVEYGVFGLPVKQIDAEGNVTSFEYDKVHQYLTKVTNAKGASWEFTYDVVGNLIRETDYNGHATDYAYTAIGQLASRTSPSGDVIRYFYDANGRIIQKHAKEGATIYRWDKQDRLVQLKTPHSTLEFRYDDRGNLLEENQNGQVIRYEYDQHGYRTVRHVEASPWLSEAETHATHYQHDANGKLIRLTLQEASPLHLYYDADGNLIRQYGEDGYVNQQQVDAKGRLERQVIGRNRLDDENAEAIPEGEPHYGFITRNYHYDGVDNLLRCEGGIHDVQWVYNRNNQITEYTQNRNSQYYQYDKCMATSQWRGSGKRETSRYSHSGQIVQRMQYENKMYHYQYDDNGCLVEKFVEQNGFRRQVQRYEWDSENRLSKVITPEGHHWHYRYDGFGRRILKHNSNTNETVHVLWDGNTIAREVSLKPRNGHSEGEEQVVEATYWHFIPNTFIPLAQQTQTNQGRLLPNCHIQPNTLQTHYISTDHMGTAIALFSQAGELRWKNRLSLWGKPNGEVIFSGYETTQPNCRLGFQGQYFDKETGLYYNYHRYYDAEMGQYISPDPIGLLGGLHPQAYVHNPNGWVDPLGLNKNSNSATGNYGVYEIKINDELYKIGKADLDRITKSSGLPTRLHQQDRKLAESFGRKNVDSRVVDRGYQTTAKAKVAEDARIQKYYDETGKIPPGNEKSFKPKQYKC